MDILELTGLAALATVLVLLALRKGRPPAEGTVGRAGPEWEPLREQRLMLLVGGLSFGILFLNASIEEEPLPMLACGEAMLATLLAAFLPHLHRRQSDASTRLRPWHVAMFALPVLYEYLMGGDAADRSALRLMWHPSLPLAAAFTAVVLLVHGARMWRGRRRAGVGIAGLLAIPLLAWAAAEGGPYLLRRSDVSSGVVAWVERVEPCREEEWRELVPIVEDLVRQGLEVPGLDRLRSRVEVGLSSAAFPAGHLVDAGVRLGFLDAVGLRALASSPVVRNGIRDLRLGWFFSPQESQLGLLHIDRECGLLEDHERRALAERLRDWILREDVHYQATATALRWLCFLDPGAADQRIRGKLEVPVRTDLSHPALSFLRYQPRRVMGAYEMLELCGEPLLAPLDALDRLTQRVIDQLGGRGGWSSDRAALWWLLQKRAARLTGREPPFWQPVVEYRKVIAVVLAGVAAVLIALRWPLAERAAGPARPAP